MELSQEIYRGILEGLPGGIYLVDRDRRVVLWNTCAEEITGHLRQEAIGRCCGDNLLMCCDENHPRLCGVACPLQQTMSDALAREVDVVLRHKDGHCVPVRVRVVPIRNAHGSIIGAAECFDERAVNGDAVAHMTHLPDRRATLGYIQEALEEFANSNVAFGVLAIAIDRLHQLRRADGRNAIKAILNVTAETLSRNLGPNGRLGRWSEVRFAAIVANCGDAKLLKTGKTLRTLVSLEGVPWWGDRLSVTLSIGGTVARAGDTPESLMDRAEQALERCILEHGDQAVVI